MLWRSAFKQPGFDDIGMDFVACAEVLMLGTKHELGNKSIALACTHVDYGHELNILHLCLHPFVEATRIRDAPHPCTVINSSQMGTPHLR
ncbi:hypothetical protein GOP47_0005477 [Adiantum capillus-veneris]|uniref:Uncharacterized protein n=1 Tax=Adiantum capillus-veneris TaxID=13818 RepID=A0A9D4V6C1_ADICA|nr:hypothetical protein GOP47_0005477 [Adiantum capillus-veneris]